jgi:hypothetical protein
LIENAMNSLSRTHVFTPAKVLLAFVFVTHFIGTIYAVGEIEFSYTIEVVSKIAVTWLIWLWFISDSREHGVTWPMDMGMFLYLAAMLIIPYHLFKTRGSGGVIPILVFLCVIVSAWFAGEVVGVFLWF